MTLKEEWKGEQEQEQEQNFPHTWSYEEWKTREPGWTHCMIDKLGESYYVEFNRIWAPMGDIRGGNKTESVQAIQKTLS